MQHEKYLKLVRPTEIVGFKYINNQNKWVGVDAYGKLKIEYVATNEQIIPWLFNKSVEPVYYMKFEKKINRRVLKDSNGDYLIGFNDVVLKFNIVSNDLCVVVGYNVGEPLCEKESKEVLEKLKNFMFGESN